MDTDGIIKEIVPVVAILALVSVVYLQGDISTTTLSLVIASIAGLGGYRVRQRMLRDK